MSRIAATLALALLAAACGRGKGPPTPTAPVAATPAAAAQCTPDQATAASQAFDARYGELVDVANQANSARTGAIVDAQRIRAHLRAAQAGVNDALGSLDEANGAAPGDKRDALLAFADDAVARSTLDLVRAREYATAYGNDVAAARSRAKNLQAAQAGTTGCAGAGGASERLAVLGQLATAIAELPEPGAIEVDIGKAEDNIRVGQAIVLDRLAKAGVKHD